MENSLWEGRSKHPSKPGLRLNLPPCCLDFLQLGGAVHPAGREISPVLLFELKPCILQDQYSRKDVLVVAVVPQLLWAQATISLTRFKASSIGGNSHLVLTPPFKTHSWG